MGKAGFTEDALIEIARIEVDDLDAAPAAPVAGQEAIYHRATKFRKKGSAGVEKTVGPQEAFEVDTATAVADNVLVGSTVQAILNKYYGPTNSEKATYLGNGEVDFIEFFSTPTQVVANRVAKATFTYDGNLNPTSEAIQLYDTNGTTVLKTLTFTHTFIGGDYDKTTQVTS